MVAHKAMLNDVGRRAQEADAEVAQHMKEERRLRNQLTERDRETSALKVQNDALRQQENDVILRALKLQDSEAVVTAKELIVEQEQQTLTDRLNDVPKLIAHLETLVNENKDTHSRHKSQLKEVEAQHSQIEAEIEESQLNTRKMEGKRDEMKRRLDEAQVQLYEVESQFRNLQQKHAYIESKHGVAKERYEEISEREEALSNLAERTSELTLQIERIEERLTPKGLKAEATESLLETRASELLTLSQEALVLIRSQVKHALLQASKTEQKLFEEDSRLREIQSKHQNANALLAERLEALRYYYKSNRAIASNPAIARHCSPNSDHAQILDAIELMLQGVDDALRIAIEANENFSKLPELRLGNS